jgi:hypothetical protein
VIIATTPAVAAAGEAIPKSSELEIAPEELSFTVIVAAPGCATSEPGIGALSIWFVP